MNLKPFGTGPLGSGPCPSLRSPLTTCSSLALFQPFLCYFLTFISSKLSFPHSKIFLVACNPSAWHVPTPIVTWLVPSCHLCLSLNVTFSTGLLGFPPTPPHPASRVATSPGHSQQSTYDCGIFSRLVFMLALSFVSHSSRASAFLSLEWI